VYGAQPPEEPQWRLPGAEQGADLAGLLVKEQEALLFLGNDAFVFHRLAAGPAPYLPWDDETEELTLYRMGSFGPLEEHERSYIAQEGGEAQYGQAAEKALSSTTRRGNRSSCGCTDTLTRPRSPSRCTQRVSA
jgi:hypothetical protein